MVGADSKSSVSRLENLRGKPKDDKTAIAGGVAIFVVAVLLIGWAILFLRKIAHENGPVDIQTQPYDLTTIRDNVGANMYSNTGTDAGGDSFYGSSAPQDPFSGSSSY